MLNWNDYHEDETPAAPQPEDAASEQELPELVSAPIAPTPVVPTPAAPAPQAPAEPSKSGHSERSERRAGPLQARAAKGQGGRLPVSVDAWHLPRGQVHRFNDRRRHRRAGDRPRLPRQTRLGLYESDRRWIRRRRSVHQGPWFFRATHGQNR